MTAADVSLSRPSRMVGYEMVDYDTPETEIQRFGDVAIVYTSYRFTTEVDGEVATSSGRGTEIFVFRDGRWVNPGWHLDSGIAGAG